MTIFSVFRKQTCEKCGWTGKTRAQKAAVASWLSYLLACVALVALWQNNPARVDKMMTWPVAAVALLWYALPSLILRTNSCGGCGERMKLEERKR
jgi:hypothetical protein